jgi:hypothetical protein
MTILRTLVRVLSIAALAAALPAAAGAQHEAEFRRLAVQISAQRQSGGEESASLFEYALGLLDNMVLAALNVPAVPDLNVINTQLGLLVERQPAVGEGYRVVRLGGIPPAYALVANFGVGGPSAVRVYKLIPGGRFRLLARIDRFSQKDFFDDYLELVPVETPSPLFVTVAGRTDELKSGAFIAWTIHGDKLEPVWSTDILTQSSYESAPNGLLLTYCSDFSEDRPKDCRKMTRERYTWDGVAWRRVEQTRLPPAAPKR